jgi:hypothetical protein
LPIATTSWPTATGCVAERCGHQVAAGRPDDGQVRERVPADDLEAELVAVDERGGSPLSRRDDVRVRDEVAIGREMRPRTRSRRPSPDRRSTRRLATEGIRRSAAVLTAVEYASSASASRPRCPSPRQGRSRRRNLAQRDHDGPTPPGGVGGAADADGPLLVAADDLQLDRQAALGEDRGQRVRVLQGASGRLDEQVAFADPRLGRGTAVLDASDAAARGGR